MGTIRFTGVSKTYAGRGGEGERVALRPLDLTIDKGEFVGLLGPNGSGKSTLLRLMVGIEPCTTGSIEPPTDRAFRSQLGVIFQHPALDPILTIRENLRLAGTLFGLRGHTLDERIGELGERFGIADRLSSRVGSLSGGLARRADLARAMLSRPAVLVIDEATASLDQGAREDFIRLIHEHRSNQTLTVVMATHRPEELEDAGRVLIMSEGEVLREDSPQSLIAELGQSELTVFSPDAPVRDVLVSSGLPFSPSGSDEVLHASRIDPGLVSSLNDLGASISLRPTDLGSVYRSIVPRDGVVLR